LTQIAGFAGTLAELEHRVRPVLEAGLPAGIGLALEAAGRRILKTGPEQFWIFAAEAEDLAGRLQPVIPPDIGAVTPLSHSRTCIGIEGEATRELLAKVIPLDFHPASFGVGRFALTGLHHTPVLVLRAGEDRYEIFAMRSFARSVWDFLADAALPLGYEVGG